MPIYNFRCVEEGCGNEEDKIVKISEREAPKECTKCKGNMYYEAFTSGDKGATFRYRGNWLNTTGRY